MIDPLVSANCKRRWFAYYWMFSAGSHVAGAPSDQMTRNSQIAFSEHTRERKEAAVGFGIDSDFDDDVGHKDGG